MQFSSVYDFKIAVSPVCCVSCISGLQAHALHAQCMVYSVSCMVYQAWQINCRRVRVRLATIDAIAFVISNHKKKIKVSLETRLFLRNLLENGCWVRSLTESTLIILFHLYSIQITVSLTGV